MFNRVYALMQHAKNRKGQGITEYALIIGFVAICVILSLKLIPEPIERIFSMVTRTLGITP